MTGGPSEPFDLASLISTIDGAQPCVTFLHTSPADAHPRMLNVGYCASAEDDVTTVPPSLKNYAWPPPCGAERRRYLATFKGNRLRSEVRTAHFDALRRHHNGSDVVVCESSDSAYDYDALLANSLFAFVLEGDLPWSYRLLEVVSAGCIPVIVMDRWVVLPLHHLIDWQQCAVLAHIDDFAETLASLPRDPRVQDAMRQRLARAYQAFLATRQLQVRAVLDILESRCSV
eukprot:7265195-Prymnesium_polylepis.1